MMASRAIGGRNALRNSRFITVPTKSFVHGDPKHLLGAVSRSIHVTRNGEHHSVAQSSSHIERVTATNVITPPITKQSYRSQIRLIHSTPFSLAPLTNEAAVNGNNGDNGAKSRLAPADISMEEYNERADAFMNELVARLEDMQEEKDDMDVEYSVRAHLIRSISPRPPSHSLLYIHHHPHPVPCHLIISPALYLTNKYRRPASLPCPSHRQARTSSTSSLRTNRSG